MRVGPAKASVSPRPRCSDVAESLEAVQGPAEALR